MDYDVREMAVRLQEAGVPALFGATETLVWHDRNLLRFAFRGLAQKLEAAMSRETRDGPGFIDNRHHRLDVALQKAVGLDASLQRTKWGMEIVGGVGQTLDDGGAHFSQVLDSLEQLVGDVLGLGEDVKFTLMPREGSPYVQAPLPSWYSHEPRPTAFYNARTRRMGTTEPPDWIVPVRVRKEDLGFYKGDPREYATVPGADMCRLVPVVERTTMPVMGQIGGVEFLVSHSFDPTPFALPDDPRPWATSVQGRREAGDAAELVRSCGGWLYPSCAVGKYASTTFGPVTLLAGVDLVLDGLSPRRKRGTVPVALYDTDVWTPNTRDMLGLGAHVLYEQLCGMAGYTVYTNAWVNHQWVLGPPVRLGGPGGVDAQVLTSERAMVAALRKRYRIWREDLDAASVMEIVERSAEAEGFAFSVYRYPYMEAKVNAIVAPTAWQRAFVAQSWARDAERFLEHVGFEGRMDVIDDPPGASYDEGWMLSHEPALAYAQSMRILDAF